MSRRMFSDEITTSDAFLDMGVGSQLLYFHLGMGADDDGFVANPKMVMRVIGSSEDDYKILVAKKFIIVFPTGVCVIKAWRINNFIRKDIYRETKYIKEKSSLFIRENGAYTLNKEGSTPVPKGHFTVKDEYKNISVNAPSTSRQLSIGKDSIDKNREMEAELPIWLNKKAWEAWLKYNKEKRKKMPPTTVRFQLRKLEKFKEQHTEMIRQSIENNWTGLFPVKNGFSGNSDAQKVLKRRIEDDEAKQEREDSAEDSEARKKIQEDIKKLAREKSI